MNCFLLPCMSQPWRHHGHTAQDCASLRLPQPSPCHQVMVNCSLLMFPGLGTRQVSVNVDRDEEMSKQTVYKQHVPQEAESALAAGGHGPLPGLLGSPRALTLGAFSAFSLRTTSPWAATSSYRDLPPGEPAEDGEETAAGGLPGLYSWPVFSLYWAFRARSCLTAASTSSFAAFLAFSSRTTSPWAATLL